MLLKGIAVALGFEPEGLVRLVLETDKVTATVHTLDDRGRVKISSGQPITHDIVVPVAPVGGDE